MRKIAVAVAFVAVVVSVWWAGNRYLAERLVLEPAWPEAVRQSLLLFLTTLAVLPLLEPVVEKLAGARRARWVAWPGYIYMGFAFFAVLALAASDALLGAAGTALGADEAASTPPVAVARAQALFAASIAALAGALALVNGLAPPRLRRLEMRLDRWPAALDGFRIAQISDLHIGAMLDREFAAHVADRVNALDADLVAVTGDLVDGSPHDLAAEVEPLARLRARHGVYFVTGNHEYYSGADPWIAHVRSLGWRVLRNERVLIERDGGGFDLAGVDDHRANLFGGDHGEDVPRAVAGRDPARALVLLAHDPSTFKVAARHGVDLQISGHTHGGQIWPFGYLVRLAVTFLAGEYERDGSRLVVSRGTGFWGPPMRLGAPAEILEIVLRSR